MTNKRRIQIIVDMPMTILLPLLMAYEMIGQAIHEWIGAAMFLLFIVHHILNYRWFTRFSKGRWNATRVISTVVNIQLFAIMIMLMISGIMISRHVFTFLPFYGGASFARTLHMVAAYWGYAFMSIHIGLHGTMFLNMIKRMTKVTDDSRVRTVITRIVPIGISLYGVYAFVKRQLIEYMTLQLQFVFFDLSEPLIVFILDYLAIMGLFACVGYYLIKTAIRINNHQG